MSLLRRYRYAIVFSVMVLIGASALAYNLYDTEMQKKFVNYNLVGHREEEGFFSSVVQPYQVDLESATNIYYRWMSSGGSTNVFIKRANLAGTVWTFTKTYTNWTMRTSAVWSAIN